MSKPTLDIKRYWSRLIRMGCVLDGRPAELAHCHGASIVRRMQEPKAKGKKLARMNWLVIPLCPQCHRTGPAALDLSPSAWERANGTQASYIDSFGEDFGLDLWALAKVGKK